MAEYIKIQVSKASLAGERIQTLIEQGDFKNATQLAIVAINRYYEALLAEDLVAASNAPREDEFRDLAMPLQLASLSKSPAASDEMPTRAKPGKSNAAPRGRG